MVAHAEEVGDRIDSLESVFDSSSAPVAITTADGTIIYCSSSLELLTGRPVEVRAGASIFALLASDAGPLEKIHALTLLTDAEQRLQVRGLASGCQACAVLRRASLAADRPVVIWSFVDTTIDNAGPLNALCGTDIGLWDWDPVNDRLTWINDWCEHSKITAFSGDGHERQWAARIHPEDLPAYRAELNRHFKNRTPSYNVEYRLRKRDDSWVWIEERGRVIHRDSTGRAVRVVGLCLDVDERHRTARDLERSESRFAHAVWGSSVGFWDQDIASDTLHWWNDWCSTIDIDPCEGIDHSTRWDAAVHPADLPLFESRHQALVNGHSTMYESEYRIRTRSGRWRWILSRGRASARDEEGRALRTVGVTIDIDARKRAELALRDSENRLDAAIWGVDVGLWEWSIEDGSMLWFSAWASRFGIDATQRLSPHEDWLARLHRQDLEKYLAEERALVAGERESAQADYRMQSCEGDWRWINVRIRVTERDAGGHALRMVGACIEVDARRRTEQMLRTQAMILETMREGVVLVDMNGCIEFANSAFDRMFARGSNDPVVPSISEIIDSKESGKSTLRPFRPARERGGALKLERTFKRRDGTQFYGKVLALAIGVRAERKVLIVIQDISERKQLESEVVEIANLERRRLGADLHDGVGQELTGISLMLRSLGNRVLPPDEPTAGTLNEIIGLVNHAIQSVRKMALGISPVTLERGGLLAALESLTAWARENYQIDCRLHLRVHAVLHVDEASATHLYLIAQEAVNNAVKHGRAESIVITLRTNSRLINLTVTDHGVGISVPSTRGSGLGLKLMSYRAGILNGVLRIGRRQKGGTQIRCICPNGLAET